MIFGIKLKKQYNSASADMIANVGSLGMGGLAKKVSRGLDSKLAKLVASSGKSLKAVLHNRMAFARPVYNRSQNTFGRAINWICMEKSNGAIEISGIELIAILNLLNEDVNIELYEHENYLVPFPESEKILNGLNEMP
jgi:hypothetical protein